MLKRTFVALTLALFAAAPQLMAQAPPETAPPQKEHDWLQQLVGEWEVEGKISPPGLEPFTSKGVEKARMLGGFWLVAEGKGEVMGMPHENILTLGYDPEKQKYVGTWVDNMMSQLWKYEGTVDASGKKLTLETKGPCPLEPGKIFNFREVIEIKDKDTKVFTSSMQGEDGEWTTFVTVTSKRKK